MYDSAIHMSGSSLIATHVWVGLSSQICLGSTEPARIKSTTNMDRYKITAHFFILCNPDRVSILKVLHRSLWTPIATYKII